MKAAELNERFQLVRVPPPAPPGRMVASWRQCPKCLHPHLAKANFPGIGEAYVCGNPQCSSVWKKADLKRHWRKQVKAYAIAKQTASASPTEEES